MRQSYDRSNELFFFLCSYLDLNGCEILCATSGLAIWPFVVTYWIDSESVPWFDVQQQGKKKTSTSTIETSETTTSWVSTLYFYKIESAYPLSLLGGGIRWPCHKQTGSLSPRHFFCPMMNACWATAGCTAKAYHFDNLWLAACPSQQEKRKYQESILR